MSRLPIVASAILMTALTPPVGAAQQANAVPLGVRWSMPITQVTRHAPSWSATDVGLASGFLALLWVDASQTRSLARRNWEGFYEANPILGRSPSEGQINTYTAAAAVATLGIAAALPPKARRWWLGAAMAVQVYTVYQTTSRLGVGLTVR